MSSTKEPQSLMTVPEEITVHEPLTLTGNEYVSLPHIDSTGGIRNLNILRLDQKGLFEFSGTDTKPLLAPLLEVEGERVKLNSKETRPGWSYRLDWLPIFNLNYYDNWSLEGEFAAPPGFKGFCIRLSFNNNSSSSIKARLGWEGSWTGFNYIVFNRRTINCDHLIRYDRWTDSLIMEASAGFPLAALALSTEPASGWSFDEANLSFEIAREVMLDPGESSEIILYAAVNLEADGAGTTGIDLRRRGYDSLLDRTCRWLKDRRINLEEPDLGELLNRNLFFCYFFSLARSLDSEELVPVTSRSPHYYVSSAFWSRDTLLWSFPAIVLTGKETARNLLVTVYKRHLKNAGDHAHYINGTVLYPGFELDQLAAFFLALAHYYRQSGDTTIFEETAIKEGLHTLVEKAFDHFDPLSGLYSTFLDPSDDPVTYPFLTYNNALLQRSFSFLAELQLGELWDHKSDFAILAKELLQAIYDHCMVKGPFGIMFAWAVDGKGKFTLYDNPPGSLQLLAHYGFCSTDDIVFKNTVRWIRSSNNRYFYLDNNFEEAGSLHAENPWPLAACNDLLACNAGAVDFFKRVEMDNGFFCESIDSKTGKVSTGAAFASAAGFLAYALANMAAESRCGEQTEQTLE